LDNDLICSVCNYNTGIGPVVLSNKIPSKLVCCSFDSTKEKKLILGIGSYINFSKNFFEAMKFNGKMIIEKTLFERRTSSLQYS
jgi:hypothetical protein